MVAVCDQSLGIIQHQHGTFTCYVLCAVVGVKQATSEEGRVREAGVHCYWRKVLWFFFTILFIKTLYQPRDGYNLEPMRRGGLDDRTKMAS